MDAQTILAIARKPSTKKIYYQIIGESYQLTKPFKIKINIYPRRDIVDHPLIFLSRKGWLWFAPWYTWDGPSGPTYDTKNSLKGSLVHDGLCELMRWGLLNRRRWRTPSDMELRRICRLDGMSLIRSHLWYRSVNVVGASASSPKSRRKILMAP